MASALDDTELNLFKRNTDTGISSPLLKIAKQAASANPIPGTIFKVKKGNFTELHLLVSDGDGNYVAGWKSLTLSMGMIALTFPESRDYSSHPIEIRPLGAGRRAEGFVKDSVTYTWENKRFKIEAKTLVKTIASEISMLAKCSQERRRNKEGFLLVDTTEVDELVAVMACVAILQNKDRWS